MDCHREELEGEMVSVSSHMTVFDKERIQGAPFNEVFHRAKEAKKVVQS